MSLNRFLLFGCFALALTAIAPADHCPTAVTWPGWTVESGEEIYSQPNWMHPKYPLTHLFDGNSATCWVYAGRTNPQQEWCKPQPWIDLVPAKPVKVEAVRIINGYAKSPELYRKNSRAGQVRVSVNSNPYHGYPKDAEKAEVTADLIDTTEFQTVRLPARLVYTLRVEVTKVRAGAIGDLCISEIELLNEGRKIEMNMPAVVKFCPGDECGCGQAWDLVARNGSLLFRDTGYMSAYDATGRYLADIRFESDRAAGFYVVDTRTGRVLFERTVRGASSGGDRIVWAGRKVTCLPAGQSARPVEFEVPPEPIRNSPASQPDAGASH